MRGEVEEERARRVIFAKRGRAGLARTGSHAQAEQVEHGRCDPT